jgi:hypothetical protein
MPSVYKIQDGDTIFDVAIATYGSLEEVYKLIQDNSTKIVSIDSELDLVAQPNLQLAYDETFVEPESQEDRQVPAVEVKNIYIVKEGQTIFDIALTLYGNVEKAYQIMQDNIESIPYINQKIRAGTLLTFNTDNADDFVLIDYLIKNNVVMNTYYPEFNNGSGFTVGLTIESYY